uniref:DNA repair protein rad18 n=1 Tax=Ganoderma boninense TaxID=34458 RepID=A0A5K1K887_9APHY|nr:DNA repair protein rad18 [Ganoderma boninense]
MFGITSAAAPRSLASTSSAATFSPFARLQIQARAVGSSRTPWTVIHWTTSPRSVIRLTRDTTNNPLWNAARFVGMDEEEDEVTGRMGRFSRRFADLGGQKADLNMDWLNEADGAEDQVVESGKGKGKPKSK